jgi:phage terminase large subunit-like protein
LGESHPRLETPIAGGHSFGGQIADWSERHLGRILFPWQVHALTGAFMHDDKLRFTHSKALVSAARQNGKTTMNAAIVGWALSELPRIWGRPVRIMSSAHELALATEVFEELRETFELWEESDLCKVTWAYGRHQVKMADGSVYAVKSATGKKHGGTWDLLLLDEVWAMSESTIFGALLPSQIAVPSPLCWMTSTAGDESSRAMSKLREQGLGLIDAGEQGDLYMAEWSLPSGVDPLDQTYWGYPNPSLGRTITIKGLQAAAAAPDRNQFLRAHCNLWVAAASSWLPVGLWNQRVADDLTHDGGPSVLAVDSAVDDSKYVAVWGRKNTSGEIVAGIKFTTDSIHDLWEQIAAALDTDPKLTLAITPSLAVHTPEKYIRRKQEWGYGELLKWTGICRSLIGEGKIKHDGGEMLAEHIARAVLVRAQNTIVVSSQRSPGPIEACRCLIAATVMVSRPTSSGRVAFGVSA